MKKKLIAVCLLIALVVLTATAAFAEGIQPRYIPCPQCSNGHLFSVIDTQLSSSLGTGPCPHCQLIGTWGEAWQINAYDCGSCSYHVTYGNPFLVHWTICPQTGAIYYW